MKKARFLVLTVLLSVLMPVCVNAKEAVNVYIFKGKTCGYCAKAIEFFTELKEDKDYKDIFNLVEYEIWYNEDNADLASAVAEEMGDELDGVPYIVIGEKTFSGYTSSYDDQIKEAIEDYYAEENPVDIVANVKAAGNYSGASTDNSTTAAGETSAYGENNKSNADTIIAIGIIVVAVVGFGYIIYISRKDTDVPAKKESIKEEKITEKPKTTTAKKTNSTTKKTNTKAKTQSKPKAKTSQAKKKK